MAAAQARPRLRLGCCKASRRARVGDLSALLHELAHLIEKNDLALVAAGDEGAAGNLRRLIGDGTAFRLPVVEAAIKDEDVPGTHHAKEPPGARRRHKAWTVIDDDRVFSRDPHGACKALECAGRRE